MTQVAIETVVDVLAPIPIRSVDYYRGFIFTKRLRRRGVEAVDIARRLKGLQTPADHADALESLARERRAITFMDAPLVAHINCARWVTPCPCGSAVPLHPAWQWAGCGDCGLTWTAVTFPDPETLEQIDAVLAEREARPGHVTPYRFYSWTPGETVDDLRTQNRKLAVALAERRASRAPGRP
jgi:hypothetical protein